ncbi:hypothetical protein GYMLUDRAFT_413708 [Collybiopsis luxurians FD-317 M1]|nr:hypothetical protein GYMLUDRAFT_413708 [Collybiopsis luxurians FD-317 M1]
MHPRNIYREGIDFVSLSNDFLPLKKYLDTHSTIDFKNQDAQRCLTEALLYRDFGLTIQLPSDRLCPPVPNRLNYVLWIQDIVCSSRHLEEDNMLAVCGIDIGTGASAIYPLLGCAIGKSWNFVASEIDPGSFGHAQRNISVNNLNERIQLVQPSPTSPILAPLFLFEETTFEFTMCNPPFYSSVEDVARSTEAKQFGPNAVCTGAEVEMITPGGESSFVGQMVEESLKTRERCRWYTSMLGKLASVEQIVDILKSHEIENYIVTEFVQGQTRRWAIGWSFHDIRLPDDISRIEHPNPAIAKCLPGHNNVLQPVSVTSKSALADTLRNVLSSIKGVAVHNRSATNRDLSDVGDAPMEVDSEVVSEFIVSAQRDTWSRSARRRQRNEDLVVEPTGPAVSSIPPISFKGSCLIVSICIKDPQPPAVTFGSRKQSGFLVEFCWRKGWDRNLFDSFCSHVSRKVSRL